MTLDLTGLLPTPEEVNQFVQDSSPQAYEHLVDRLLASPAFGEQRARYWLDYARYADTYGLHFDNSRYIWAYRDYLIKAFNTNKPFDQFAKEQIAGDLLPPRNLDQIIASGYVRSGVSSNEGGTIPEELRVNIARERTEAYGAAFLGLTVGCAVCHDHKYDPTTQKDFYQLSAFFNNINEQPFNGDKPNWAPVVHIPKPQNLEAYNPLLSKRAELQRQLDALRLQDRVLVQRWLASKQNPAQPVSTDKLLLRLRLDEGGGEVLKNSAPNANPKELSHWEVQAAVGGNHLAVAGFPHGHQHPGGDGTDRRLRREPAFFERWLVHAALRAKFHFIEGGGCADLEDGFHPARPRLGSGGGERHDQRQAGRPGAEGTTGS